MAYRFIDLITKDEIEGGGAFKNLGDAETYVIGLYQDDTPIGIYSSEKDLFLDAPESIVYSGTVYKS